MKKNQASKINIRYFVLAFIVLSINFLSGTVYSQRMLRLSDNDTVNYIPEPLTLAIYLSNKLCKDCITDIIESDFIDSLVNFSDARVDVIFAGFFTETALLANFKKIKKKIDEKNIFLALEVNRGRAYKPSPYMIICKNDQKYFFDYDSLYKTELLNLDGVRRCLSK